MNNYVDGCIWLCAHTIIQQKPATYDKRGWKWGGDKGMGLKSKAEKWISAILFKLFDDFAMSRIHFVHVVDNSWKINSNCCTLDVSKSRRLPYIIDHTIQDSDLWDFVVRHSSWNSEIFDIWCESLCNTDMNAIFVGCMPRYFFFMFTFSSTVDSIRGWTFFVSFWVLLRSTVRSTLAYYTFSIRRRLTILKKKNMAFNDILTAYTENQNR